MGSEASFLKKQCTFIGREGDRGGKGVMLRFVH